MCSLQPNSFSEFEREAERGNVVPVVRTMTSIGLNPTSAFSRIGSRSPYAFLLASAEGGQQVARFSFLGANPEMIVRGKGETTVIERNGVREKLNMRAFDFVRDHFRHRKLTRNSAVGPFAGGAVGYLGYGASSWFEPAIKYSESNCDDTVLMFYKTVIVFDHAKQTVDIKSVVFTEEAEGDTDRLEQLYLAAAEETARLVDQLSKPIEVPDLQSGSLPVGVNDLEFDSNWTREGFEKAVAIVKLQIAAGYCYQVVLSQRFTRQTTTDPVLIFGYLQMINPSPYMYLLRLEDQTVIGASPEMLVRCRGSRLDYRPIAGTRRRGLSSAEDWLLANEMRNDPKELAEHMMLVDLGRNDLGKVADFGSVHADDLAIVEAYSHVQHLVSNLRGRLRVDCDRFDAFASCFPAGTVTGAPKVSAMNIIRSLEPEPRGIYGGAVLYADYANNLDSCIAIRTIVLRDGEASIQAGAGIVADSIAEREYQETVDKAQALFRAIELAERRA